MKWCAKIAAKIVLSRLPVPYNVWNRIGLFVHGKMNRTDYALKIFNHHSRIAWPGGLPPGFTALELGPGDSLASALVAKAHGAKRTWLVDVGAFAKDDVAIYRSMAEDLRAKGLDAPDLSKARTIEEVLAACDGVYLTDGLESLKSLSAQSVDFIWSHAVLEHVKKDEFSAVMAELRRISKPDGVSSHNVDFRDHLDYSLHNLRFPEKIWESGLFSKSGFYTNRIRAPQMLRILRDVGYEIRSEDFGKWEKIPLDRSKLHEDFRDLPENDLLIRTMHAVLQPQKAA